MAGRPPKPLALHRLEGTLRKHRHTGQEVIASGEPVPPDHLDKEAKVEFARVVAELRAMNLLASADAATIGLHAQTFSRWAQAERGVQEFGPVIRSTSGEAKVNPWVRIAQESVNQLRQLASELALSPVARARVTTRTAPPKKESKWAGKLASLAGGAS